MDPSEVEFVAEKEKISILTNFSENKIYLIGVSFVCRLLLWAQLFEGRLALNPGLSLTRVFFSFVQKPFLR